MLNDIEICIFFFQAEDGIRDDLVTGVQTCALPISQQIVCLHEGLSLQVTQGGVEHTDELTQKGNSAGGCDMVARARRAEERPWGGARESWSTGNSRRSDWKREMLVWKKMKKASD